MNNLHNASIRDKLRFLLIRSILLTMLFSGGVLLVNTTLSTKQLLENELNVLSEITALAITPSLIFDNQQDAQQTLNTLQAHQNVVYASISKNEQQTPFAIYSRNIDSIPPKVLSTECLAENFSLRFMQVCKTLSYDQVEYGKILLIISLDNIYQQLLKEMAFAFIGLACAALLIFWFMEKIAKKISDPILELVALSKEIKESADYTKRTTVTSNDETGLLGQAFNDMLEQIHTRNIALNKQNNTLEEQVQQRTLDLTKAKNKALILADKAQKASAAKSEFLATMSHEIRTPMNGVMGMTELLLLSNLSSRQKRLADTAFRSAKSLLGIINNILDFSKIESGKFQLTLSCFELRPLLEETIELLAPQAHSKGLELLLNLPPDLSATVQGDSDRLRQILVNLLNNAIKFTQLGEVELKVSWVQPYQADKPIELLFEIKDSGPGIALEKQDLIFDSFTQADGSITRQHGGTGLGLSISRKLLAMMGSQLQLNSTENKGSCFSYKLKFPHGQIPLPDIQNTAINELQGSHILIVDDNETNIEILSTQLTQWGVQFHTAANGKQALEQLLNASKQNMHYQIALLDYHMPDIDGLALAQAIQSDPEIQNIPLVMLSSSNTSIEQSQAQSYGIEYFLNKPVTQQRLFHCLLKLLHSPVIQHSQASPSHDNIDSDKLPNYILLAEDNPVNQEVGLAILRTLGCQSEVVSNGLDAVNIIKEKQFDAILMDCHMPEMDGFEATKTIRQWEKNQDLKPIPIIALTADVQKGIIDQCLEIDMNDYISKPFDIEHLKKILKKWLAPQKRLQITENSTPNSGTQLESFHLHSETLNSLKSLKTESGEPLLNKSIHLFQDHAPKQLQLLENAYAQQNTSDLTNHAHSLKSACANLGAIKLAACAESIESISKQGETDNIKTLLNTIKTDLPEVINELNQSIATTAPKDQQPVKEYPEEQTKKHILIVDDDHGFRLIAHSSLTAASFSVEQAESGAEALEIAKQQQPDAILLDAMMEPLDGFETCRLLRKQPELSDTAIIMCTGLHDIDAINRAFESGATDFIVKPINYTILIHRLNFILRASQESSELRHSKVQLSTAQHIAHLGYWVWDKEKDHFQLSEQLADLCNIDIVFFQPTLNGFINIIAEEDQERVKKIILQCPENDTSNYIEYRIQTEEDTLIFVQQEMIKSIENGRPILTGTVQDISQRKQNEKKIHNLAYFDNITGLASRTHYQEYIESTIQSARLDKQQFAFLFLDLDGFKDINDSLGHDLGDHLLKIIADRLKTIVRDNDFTARLGGDEFCLILNNIENESYVAEIAKRCLQKINKSLFLNKQEIKPRVSIGIAIFPQHGDNETDLMKAADTAMYAAKQAGKQRFVFYSDNMAVAAVSRLEKEMMLRDAFEQNQFILHYQPQISMDNGHMVSMEALARWQHPEKGMIPPGLFIPDIERLGLVNDLGNWAIKTACEQIARWHQSGLPYLQVAVNLSATHFQDTGLIQTVENILSETQVPAQYLELEVTESAMQENHCLDVIKQLRGIGIKISIDDFGTGYSCLASLKQLPLDSIKIDKVFVDDVLTNPHTPLLLGAIIGLANALDYQLVAEGVETEEQAMIMHGLGCELIQGYFFSRPVSSDTIPGLVEINFKQKHDS